MSFSDFSSCRMDSLLNSLSTVDQKTYPFEDMIRQLQFFWKNSKYTDVQFEVGSNLRVAQFNAHRLLISMWSPVLANLLSTSGESIKITDAQPSAFEAMLRFMYGLNPVNASTVTDIDFVLSVVNIAQRYQVPKLEKIGLKILLEKFPNIENVFQLLYASKILGSKLIEERCNNLIQTRTLEVLSVNKEKIALSTVDLILDMPCLSFPSRYEFLLWCFNWALSQEKSAIPFLLPKLLPDILQLKPEEFGEICIIFKDVFSESDGFKIFLNIIKKHSTDLPSWSEPSYFTKSNRVYM